MAARSSTMAAKLASPVQRLTTSAAIWSALNTRSGASSTQPPWASLWTSRTPRGRRGRASGKIDGAAAGGVTWGSPFFFSLPPKRGGGEALPRDEGARRKVLGHHGGMGERGEPHPQHVAFEFEGLENERLLLRRFRVLPHVGECKVAVAPRLGRPGGEIRERLGGDEIVVLEHALDALADDEGRKQFGERRGDGLKQRLFGDEMHIGFDRKARCRKQALKRCDVVAVKSDTLGQLQPAPHPPCPAPIP